MIRFFASGLLSLALLTGPARAAGHFATVPTRRTPPPIICFFCMAPFSKNIPTEPHTRDRALRMTGAES